MSKQRRIGFKNTIFMSASAIVFLAAGCNLDSDTVETMGGLNLGSETAANVSAAGARDNLATLADDNDTFAITSTVIVEETNTINVVLQGDTGNTDSGATHGAIDDDDVDDLDPGDGTENGMVTLSLAFRNDVPSGSPFGDRNAPEWTEVGDRRYLYYRNRARRSQNADGLPAVEDVISRGDPNYAEYHAMAYITNPDQENNRQELVRVEVIYLNYNDGIDINQGSGAVNFNALETDSDKIALGIATAADTQTAISELPSGRAQYAGYYLGQNRIRTTVTGIPGITLIDAKENNIPTMTLSFDFDDADGSFRINDARLKADTDPDGTEDNRIRAEITMDISGTITSLPTGSDPEFDGRITQLDVSGDLNGLFNREQDDEQSIRMRLTQRFYDTQNEEGTRATFDTTSTGGVNEANSLTGQFFNDGRSFGHIVAGTIDADLQTSTVMVTDEISYSLRHYMLGVFIAERYTAR
jgi:hypothetical protein